MKLTGIARAVPRRVVTNDELIDRVMAHQENKIPGLQRPLFRRALREILRHTGAETRRHRGDDETAFDLGVAAGRSAMERAGVRPSEIDLLIYVGVGRAFLEPATACLFQSALGMTNATCFDLLDACASWMRGLDLAKRYLDAGIYRRVMLLNCECNFEEFIRWDFHSLEDLEHMGVGFTVGEASTATILEASDDDEYYATFRTDGRQHVLCQVPLPHTAQFVPDADLRLHPSLHFFSYGRKLIHVAVEQLDRHFHADPRLGAYSADLIVGHTVGVPTSQTVLQRLELDPAKYVETFHAYGNTVSASLPMGLTVAQDEGRLNRGDRVLLLMGSAGVTTGFTTFRY